MASDVRFFSFAHPVLEVKRKVASRTPEPSVLMGRLLDEAALLLSSEDLERTRELGDILLKLPFDRVYPRYLNHPIRVAASYLAQIERPSYHDAALALCHNVRETQCFDDVDAAGFLSTRTNAGILALTTDRARERDPEYLAAYYDGIVVAGQDVMLLKALDKLDNVLELPALDLNPREYLLTIQRHVAPRIERTHPHIATYLGTLIRHIGG